MRSLRAPPRKERNAELTKKRILLAAEGEFAAKGFDGARLRNIARAAGVQEALIHHYFDAKEGLYHEVLRGGLDAMAAGIWPIVRDMSTATPWKKKRLPAQMRALTESFVDLLLNFFASNGSFLAILRHEAQRGELAARIVADSVRPVFDAIVQELDAMRARGEVRSDVDARHLCLSAVGMVSFPYQEETFVTSIWPVRVRERAFHEQRRSEIVEMILARVLP